MSFVCKNYIKNKCFYKRGRKSKKIGIRSFFWCLSTHVWVFFFCGCVSGVRHWKASISHVWTSKNTKKLLPFLGSIKLHLKKEPKNPKKNRNETLFYVQVPMFGVFFCGCSSGVRYWRGTICHVWTSKNTKKLLPFPGSIKLHLKKEPENPKK